MKYIVILFCLNFYFITASGQDTILLNVVYEFNYVRDLDNRADPYKETMVLSLGKNSSRYCSEKLFNDNNQKIIEARRREQEKSESNPSEARVTVVGNPMLIISKNGAIINEEVTKNFLQKKITIDAKVGLRIYHAETDLFDIKWSILTETKKINKYNCQKASGFYGGRNYTVWFTNQIPGRDGPWKLHGLPGLIVEAKDSANEVSFSLKEINKNTNNEEMVQSFLNSIFSIKANVKDINKAKIAFEIDPEGVISAQAPNATVRIKNIDNPNDKTVVKIKKYNPIER